MPKLGLGAHLFEEHQIHHLWHVNAGVHHINRYCNVRFLVRLLEIIDDVLRIVIITHHTLGKLAPVLRIEHIEPLHNIIGMALVLRKNDGLAQSVAPSHMNATLHNILQNHIHRGLVEHKLVQRIGRDKLRHLLILGKSVLVAALVLVA